MRAGRQPNVPCLILRVPCPDGVPHPCKRPDLYGRRALTQCCAMVVNLKHARASAAFGGTTFHFCSENCRDVFLRDPARYAAACGARSAP